MISRKKLVILVPLFAALAANWIAFTKYAIFEATVLGALIWLAVLPLVIAHLSGATTANGSGLEAAYGDVLRRTGLAVAITDRSGNLIHVNPALERLCGYGSDYLVGRPFTDLVPESLRPWLLFQHNESAQGSPQNVQMGELQLRRSDGRLIEVHADTTRVETGGGRAFKALTFLDVTEQNRLRNAMQEAQRIGRIGNWQLDLSSGKMEWSRQLFRLFGLEHLDCAPAYPDFRKRLRTIDAERLDAALKATVQSGHPFDLEIEIPSTNGRSIVLYLRGTPLLDGDGNASMVVGVAQDISRRKQIEQHLAEANERLKLAASSTQIGIWEYWIREKRLEWDDTMCELFGIPREQFAGDYKTWRDCVHPDDLASVELDLNSAIENRTSFSTSFRIRRPVNGQLRCLSARGIVFTGEDGTPERVLGTNWDITTERLFQQELEELSNRLRMAIRAASMGVWEYCFQTGVLYWSDELFQIHKLSSSRFDGSWDMWARVIAPDDLERFREDWAAAVEHKSELDGRYRLSSDHSEAHWIALRAEVQHGEKGAPLKAVGLSWDITREKLAEETAENARKAAEEAARAKSAFLATMSHEIRTPMNGVVGMTNILEDTNLDSEQKECVSIIRSSGETLIALINDILDFSKIEAGKLELEQEPFDLRESVEECLELLVPQAHTKNLELACLISEDVPRTVIGDVTRLRQILINLLGNGVKFTRHGEVYLEVQCSKLEGNRVELHFSVRDTGIGIPESKMHLLFESFSQVDASTTREFGGTGLGLTICRCLCELMEGRIWAESEAGVGSTFHFTARVDAVAPNARVTTSGSDPVMEGHRVLVVDDNSTNRRILNLQLTSWGMHPVLAGSAAEAMEILMNPDIEPFDLAILDMHMPGTDGAMLAASIRNETRLEMLPLVLLSSIGDMVDTTLFNVVMTKPARKADMRTAVLKCLAPLDCGSGEIQPGTTSPHPREFSPLRILLAEDNQVNQRVLHIMLERLGYRADLVKDGQEVIDRLSNGDSYDLVLMDLQMPFVDGLQATRRIIDTIPTKRLPQIIAVTANAMQGAREAALEAGMKDYLTKPVDLNALRNVLENAKKAAKVE